MITSTQAAEENWLDRKKRRKFDNQPAQKRSKILRKILFLQYFSTSLNLNPTEEKDVYNEVLLGTGRCVNVKNYYHNGDFVSNGVDLDGGRIGTVLSDFFKSYTESMPIHSIELLLDDSLNYGSLIINDFLEIRFGKLGRPKRQKKYHIFGISTDYETPSNSTQRKVNTHAARMTKSHFSFRRSLVRFKNDPAISELVLCVMKKFPNAIS